MSYLLYSNGDLVMDSVKPETFSEKVYQNSGQAQGNFFEKSFIKNSASPQAFSKKGLTDSELSLLEREIFDLVLANWPTSSLEIAEHFKENISSREDRRKISTRYSYYLKKLISKRLLLSKRVGNALIVWPLVAEKYRAIHEILKPELSSNHLQNKSFRVNSV